MTTLYRGVSKQESGIPFRSCWTKDQEAAESYGETLRVWEVDLDALTVLEAPAYDRDEDLAPGDTARDAQEWAARGADLIVYEDEDVHGHPITTYRAVRDIAFH